MHAKRTLALVFAIAVVWLPGKPGLTFEPMLLNLSGSFSLGSDDASVTLVEFSDYECFYCRRHAMQILPLIVEAYVKTGKLRYVVSEFAPDDFDAPGFMAVEAALCAGDQNTYWEMRTLLFENQEALSTEALLAHAQSLGLEMMSFEQCLAERIHHDTALRDYRFAKGVGIDSVPMFFLGITDPDNPSRIHVTKWITGSKGFGVYASAIDSLYLQAKAKGEAGAKSEIE
jgi:hypothetical protein